MKRIYIISFEKKKDPLIESLAHRYSKRSKIFNIIFLNFKPDQKAGKRVREFIKTCGITQSSAFLLGESKKAMNSIEFSKYLEKNLEQIPHHFAFFIGGATGHISEVAELSQKFLSLSPLTFPHKIAKIVLVEQLYRAETLINGHPYHNE